MASPSDGAREQMAEATRRALELAPGSDRRLAELADVSPSLLSRVRSGESGVSVATMRKIAGALKEQRLRAEQAEEVLWGVITRIE